MQEDQINIGSTSISIDAIILAIHATRNEKISEALNDSNLSGLLETEYGIFKISTVKKEFLKRDLIELRNTTLDLVHYASLIKELKDANTITPDPLHPLFLKQLQLVFNKYCK